MKILINIPDINNLGGVADHFRGLKNKFTNEIIYNEIGGKSKSYLFIFKQALDYIVFIYKLIKHKPDIIHLNPSLNKKSIYRDSIFLLLSRLFRMKILIFWHGWDPIYDRLISKSKRKVICFRRVFNKSSAMCVLSGEFEKSLRRWGIVVPIYHETTKVDDDLLAIRKEKNFRGQINILFLSRVIEEKGIFIVLDTFKLLKDKSVHLIVAGDGVDLKRAKDYCRENSIKGVTFSGYLRGEDKSDVFNRSHIYFFPTYYGEGMPTSLLEAMAFGLAIITRHVGGLSDFFRNPEMGYITDSKDPKIFLEMVESLLMNKEKLQNVSETNLNYAKQNFLASIVAKRIEKIYIRVSQN